jgi:hypothetical protein
MQAASAQVRSKTYSNFVSALHFVVTDQGSNLGPQG